MVYVLKLAYQMEQFTGGIANFTFIILRCLTKILFKLFSVQGSFQMYFLLPQACARLVALNRL
jgi:hypothetical protein